MNTTPLDERGTAPTAWINQTQEVLAHRSLNQQPFHRVFNLMRTRRLATVALNRVLANTGARTAGIDGMTKKHIATDAEQQALVQEIWHDLTTHQYRPVPVRRVYIPKANGQQRPLGIPTIKDRVVQEMVRLILDPIYESTFYRHSYGFRPYRATHHAVVRLRDLIGRRGYQMALEGDIRACFDRIHHSTLIRILRRTIKDERLITVIHQMLKAGVMDDGHWRVTEDGTPQGGIVSPLLANIYLNELDQWVANRWDTYTALERYYHRKAGTGYPCQITRYADDFVVLLHGTHAEATTLKTALATFLADHLHLELSAEKTLITPVEQGFDFLGFHIRKYQDSTRITPSRKAIATFKREAADRIGKGFRDSDEAGIVMLNHYLTGWGHYYRRVSSSATFRSLDHYIWWRVMRTTFRLRRGRGVRHFGTHCRSHRKRYRDGLNRKHAHRRGGHYGVWANTAQTRAYIVTTLAFLPIEYVALHPQLHPYRKADRAKLDQRKRLALLLARNSHPERPANPAYGKAWEQIRQQVLQMSNYTCQHCGTRVHRSTAEIDHRIPLKRFTRRQTAHKLENLQCLCRACHLRKHGKEPR